jgi:hypothetical protein
MYTYVSERRVYNYPRVCTPIEMLQIKKNRSTAGRGYAQKVKRGEEQEIQARKAEQNARIERRPGLDYTVDKKPKKKVRFRSKSYRDDDLSESVRNLRLAQRSGRDRRRHYKTLPSGAEAPRDSEVDIRPHSGILIYWEIEMHTLRNVI